MEATTTRPVTDADLLQFCEDQQARYDAYRAANGFTNDLHKREHVFTKGGRFARIIRQDKPGLFPAERSVVVFIDLTNGDIHKGSWKAPVKNGKRGNIFAADRGASCMGQYGPRYLR